MRRILAWHTLLEAPPDHSHQEQACSEQPRWNRNTVKFPEKSDHIISTFLWSDISRGGTTRMLDFFDFNMPK